MSFVRYHRLGSLFGSTDNPDIMKYQLEIRNAALSYSSNAAVLDIFSRCKLQMLHEWFVSARQRPPAIMLHL